MNATEKQQQCSFLKVTMQLTWPLHKERANQFMDAIALFYSNSERLGRSRGGNIEKRPFGPVRQCCDHGLLPVQPSQRPSQTFSSRGNILDSSKCCLRGLGAPWAFPCGPITFLGPLVLTAFNKKQKWIETKWNLSIYKYFSVNQLGREQDIPTFPLSRSKEREEESKEVGVGERGGRNRVWIVEIISPLCPHRALRRENITGRCVSYPLTHNYPLIIMSILKMGTPRSRAAQ